MILVTFEYQNTTYSTVCIGDINSKYIIDKAENIFNVEIINSTEYDSKAILFTNSIYHITVDFIEIDSLSFPSFIPAETYLNNIQQRLHLDSIDDVLEYIIRRLS